MYCDLERLRQAQQESIIHKILAALGVLGIVIWCAVYFSWLHPYVQFTTRVHKTTCTVVANATLGLRDGSCSGDASFVVETIQVHYPEKKGVASGCVYNGVVQSPVTGDYRSKTCTYDYKNWKNWPCRLCGCGEDATSFDHCDNVLRACASQYTIGDQVTCFFDPKQSETQVWLDPDTGSLNSAVLTSLIVMSVFCWLFPLYSIVFCCVQCVIPLTETLYWERRALQNVKRAAPAAKFT
eukprot:c10985_g1_i1.p1 GENE.c10985_g1_i1~~c10985_g1_i1.p1  ORF type:complete len:239 (-),score=44.96 c10985_g1_i1:76-792(-)